MRYYIYEINDNNIPYKLIRLQQWEEPEGGFLTIEDAQEVINKSKNPSLMVGKRYAIIAVVEKTEIGSM